MLPPEKYSTVTGRFKTRKSVYRLASKLKIEGETSVDAALILGEDQQ